MAAIFAGASALAHAQSSSLRTGIAASLGVFACVFCLAASSVDAASNKVRISDLADVSFGTVSDFSADAIQSQSLCLYADTASRGYNITASGSGPAGAFQLAAGSQALAYEVQWNGAANRTSGTRLDPNLPLSGQVSGATQQTCNNGPTSSASLILILRAAVLSGARAGNYSGTLTLLVGPE